MGDTDVMLLTPVALAAWLVVQAAPALFTADAEPPSGLLELGDEQVELRDAPTPAAEVTARITRDAADEIRLIRIRVVTREAGVLRSVADGAVVRGADYGARSHVPVQPPGTVVAAAEATVEVSGEVAYLQDSPGGCFVSVDSRVIDAMPCPSGDPLFQVERQPRVEWWGFLRLSDGRSGWILMARHGPA
jgi:hypothetical protein